MEGPAVNVVDMSDASLEWCIESTSAEIESLEKELENTQAALSKKRKLRTDAEREVTSRAVADAQSKAKEKVEGKSVKARLRVLAMLVRTYINETHAEFYGNGLGVRTVYDAETACVKFGRHGAFSIRVEADGTAARETWETHTVNVLDDHPRTWRL